MGHPSTRAGGTCGCFGACPWTRPAKLLDLQMLVMATGRECTEAEWSALLPAGGFTAAPRPHPSSVEHDRGGAGVITT